LVNGIAERSVGFVWRYTDESGNATNRLLKNSIHAGVGV
jgi:hypothetical protein